MAHFKLSGSFPKNRHYNFYFSGLTYRSANQVEKSMEQFVKLQMVLRHQPEVLFQIANLNEDLGNDEQAIEW